MPISKHILIARCSLAASTLLAVAASCTPPNGSGPDVQPNTTQVQSVRETAQAITPEAQASQFNLNTTPAGVPSQAGNLAATTTALAATMAALVDPAGTPTVQPVAAADAATVINTYAQEVLGLSVTIIQAGGLTTDLTRQLNLSEAGTSAQSATADVALESYGALLANGVGTVSYGSGTLSGDVNVDLNASSLGAFSLRGGPNMPSAEAEALALVLQTFPGLSDRTYTAQTVAQGFAWLAEGQVSGFDVQTRQATLVAERVLIGVIPTGRTGALVYAVVGKGDFAANVQP